ncbi:TetR/AcrR family transcriptional regulator [Dactylosporangium sp. CA-139066]|uniref:TetR/AcrR family transcriptional regulator n=1 Tax=Dactylosporangium sp. CA-139066 TaxID=3239930 RepID=UPI003D8F2CC8
MRSTAEARRAAVLNAAVATFARTGYHATPVTAVAAAAGISEAYALRLFGGSKQGLFVAAVEACYDRIYTTLERAVAESGTEDVEQRIEAMGEAYAKLIADKDLLLLQVHAQGASDNEEVRATVRAGYKRLVLFMANLGATGAQIQEFIAYGQLCHLIVTAGLDDVRDSWAKAVTSGMRHVK